MRKNVSILSFMLLIGCKNTNTSSAQDNQTSPDTGRSVATTLPAENKLKQNKPGEYPMTWTDSLIVQYIEHTDNKFVVMTRKDSARIEWMLDRREHTDTADYLIYSVYHSFEHHSVPDACLYIDSLTRTVYEYDVPGDSLIKWTKKQ